MKDYKQKTQTDIIIEAYKELLKERKTLSLSNITKRVFENIESRAYDLTIEGAELMTSSSIKEVLEKESISFIDEDLKRKNVSQQSIF